MKPLALTHGGITDSLSGWARRTGIPRTTLCRRLGLGWSLEHVLTTEIMGPKQRCQIARERKRSLKVWSPECAGTTPRIVPTGRKSEVRP